MHASTIEKAIIEAIKKAFELKEIKLNDNEVKQIQKIVNEILNSEISGDIIA